VSPAVSLVVSLLSLTGPAAAWEDIDATWASEDFPLPYFIAEDIGGLDDAAAVAAIQAGFQTWEDAGCGVSFAYQGRASGEGFGDIDGVNVVYFVDEGWAEEPTLLSLPTIVVDGDRIVEADLAFNGEFFTWAVDGDGVIHFDLQASVTHEVGHFIGLWHTIDPDASLNDFLNGKPEARTLGDDDLEGLCALYGGGGEWQIGDPCSESGECGGELFCLEDGADRYCSASCEEDAECPEGYACYDLGGDERACAVGEAEAKGCGGCSVGLGGGSPAGRLGFAGLLGLLLVRRRM